MAPAPGDPGEAADGSSPLAPMPPAALPLELRLFGPLDVRVHGQPLPQVASRKGRWALALLALRSGKEVDREWLAGTLWPESAPPQAYYNLRQHLSELRAALGDQAARLFAPTRRTLCLDLSGAWLDVAAFDGALARGDRASLEEAVALYRGPLLEGCLEEWALPERESREQAHLQALERLAAAAAGSGETAAAVVFLRQALAAEPLRETAARALMAALSAEDEVAAALQVYHDLRRRLHRELNAAPAPETAALFETIRQRAGTTAAPRRRPEGTRSADPVGVGGRLPRPLTRLIGREGELEQVRARLAEARLVTLTGAGGVGKTRLAIHAAGQFADPHSITQSPNHPITFPDGVCFVELAALEDPKRVLEAVAAALGVREEPARPLVESLQAALASRALLLVLDNCEHLVEACAELAGMLLRACPELRILATSREQLRIGGEAVLRVPPLAVPPDAALAAPAEDAGSLLDYEAVRLFVERAALVSSDFRVTPERLRTIGGICRRLDGIPLAIELAAARVPSLSLDQLAARLGESFRMLTGGSRDALPRQQTLEAAIGWSYLLLTSEEQTLVQRLSAFAGGWTLEASEAVCRVEGLDLPNGLVEKSLVERHADSGRYRMLESVRRYAAERLRESGEETALRDRHLAWCLEEVEAGGPPAGEEGSGAWLARAAAEQDNFRAALRWSYRTGQWSEAEPKRALAPSPSEAGLRLATALFPVWSGRPLLAEGRESLGAAMAAAGTDAPAALRGAALDAAGRLAHLQGDFPAAFDLLEQALAAARAAGDAAGEVRSLAHLGDMLSSQGKYPEARPLLEQALAIVREIGHAHDEVMVLDALAFVAREEGEPALARSLLEEGLALAGRIRAPAREAGCLINLGFVEYEEGNNREARGLFEEALTLAQRIGDRGREARCLCSLGIISRREGDYDRAADLMEQALAINRQIGDRSGEAWNLGDLGGVELYRRNYARAHSLFEQALRLNRDLQSLNGQAWNLVGLACATHALGDYREARRYHRDALEFARSLQMQSALRGALASCAQLLAAVGQPAPAAHLCAMLLHGRGIPARVEEELAQASGALRSELGEEAFARAREEGHAMTLDQACALALEALERPGA